MDETTGPLTPYLVLDLGGIWGALAGRVLADLGAEVVRVEPPGGSRLRKLPPFDATTGASLFWAGVALNTRSVVLDLDAQADRRTLFDLLARADVLVEGHAPGYLAARGLGYDDLAALNPGLVYVSVTPYGQDGPKAAAPASDLTIQAAGGLVSLQGDPDRPPLQVGAPYQAILHAGAQAAAEAAVALNERARSGLGQHIDVSAQACVVWTLMHATGFPPNEGRNPPGRGGNESEPLPGVRRPKIWACKDGQAYFMFGYGPLTAASDAELVAWMAEEGAAGAELRAQDWRTLIADVAAGRITAEQSAAYLARVAAFLAGKTGAELVQRSLDRGLLYAPAPDVPGLYADPHLAARDFWQPVEAGGRTVLHPGPHARLTATPITLRRAAPRLGQDQAWLATLLGQPWRGEGNNGNGASDTAHPAGSSSPLPHTSFPSPEGRLPAFAGLKVVDFSWVGVGPLIAKGIADHGATVIRIESERRPDVLRGAPPFKDRQPGLDRAQFWANFNTSKLGLACDLGHPLGRELAWRLIAWADVVTESFSAGTLPRLLGTTYEKLLAERPDLIILSTTLRGQTGPQRQMVGYGGQGAAMAGFHTLTGWPDRMPAGTWGAYTDFINPRFGIATLAAAIDHRRRTGQGQHIDLAQTEAALRLMEPLLLDYAVNGRVATPPGNAAGYAMPHAVYACAPAPVTVEGPGEDWVAIACETDAQWRALAALIGCDALAGATVAERRPLAERIDAAISAWAAARDKFAAERELLAAGVPAAAVLLPSDLYEDAQLAHRSFFVTLDHAVMGPTPYDGPAARWSATPPRLRAAPILGQHTDQVLREVLGLSDEEIIRYAEAGVLA